MTRPKPKIRKGADGWEIIRPRCGFQGPEQLGPYPDQAAAVAALQGTVKVGSAGPNIDRTWTPEPRRTWGGRQLWQPVIR